MESNREHTIFERELQRITGMRIHHLIKLSKIRIKARIEYPQDSRRCMIEEHFIVFSKVCLQESLTLFIANNYAQEQSKIVTS